MAGSKENSGEVSKGKRERKWENTETETTWKTKGTGTVYMY